MLSETATTPSGDKVFSVRPRNHSSFYCPDCGHSLKTKDVRSGGALCRICDNRYDSEEAGVYLQSSCVKFYNNPATVLNSNWFHYTREPDWLKRTQEDNAWVHIGTRFASEHMAGVYNLRRTTPVTGDLHSVRIKPETHVNNTVLDDFITGWSYHSQDWDEKRNAEPFNLYTRIRYRGPNPFIEGANLYVNRYESAGSVSIFIPAHCLEVISTKTLDIP